MKKLQLTSITLLLGVLLMMQACHDKDSDKVADKKCIDAASKVAITLTPMDSTLAFDMYRYYINNVNKGSAKTMIAPYATKRIYFKAAELMQLCQQALNNGDSNVYAAICGFTPDAAAMYAKAHNRVNESDLSDKTAIILGAVNKKHKYKSKGSVRIKLQWYMNSIICPPPCLPCSDSCKVSIPNDEGFNSLSIGLSKPVQAANK